MKGQLLTGIGGLWLGAFFAFAATTSMPVLEELSTLPGAPGFEKPVREYLVQQWQPYLSEWHQDGMGNILARHKHNQQGPHLLLMAHMDEVGLMIETITEEGFLKAIPLGAIANTVLFAQRWQIISDKGVVEAYSGVDSPQLVPDSHAQPPDKAALFLDIGAISKQQAEQQFGMRPGLPVTPKSTFVALSDRRFMGKALDDRIGLAAITDALKLLRHQQPNQLYVAATVQEELGMRGATTVYEGSKADIVINVKVGLADDYPRWGAERKNQIRLGGGPTLLLYDRSMIPNQELVHWVMALARKNQIPLQLEIETAYEQDGAKLQTSGTGVPALNLGIPVRYGHQQAGVFDKKDYDQLVKLLVLIIENLGPDAYKQIRST
ncbi:MAG: M42 family metallopeptidase [Legionellaceae bacterium]|nr:M42 family metallopeptidase [Legionellaceae bacterium]